MDTACLDYCLTAQERGEFEQNGFLIVPDALPPQMVEDVKTVVDRLNGELRAEKELGPHDRLHCIDFVGKDEIFLELLDWHRILPKVWGILSWNIQLYLSHMDVTPPLAPDAERKKKRLGWHQDSGRLNIEIESNPRPRISVKVAYFLSDKQQKRAGEISTLFREPIYRTNSSFPMTKCPIRAVQPPFVCHPARQSFSIGGCGTAQVRIIRISRARYFFTVTVTDGCDQETM